MIRIRTSPKLCPHLAQINLSLKAKVIQIFLCQTNTPTHFHFAKESNQNLSAKTITNAVKIVYVNNRKLAKKNLLILHHFKLPDSHLRSL